MKPPWATSPGTTVNSVVPVNTEGLADFPDHQRTLFSAVPHHSTAPARNRAANPQAGDETRAEISRILTSSVSSGSITPENRTQLAQLVSQRTGIPQAEAERRVDQAVNEARAAADKARRAAILTAFVTAAGLILSLAAGWWAAMRGGHHRDTSIPARFTFGERRRVS
jgi:hypothetical protein